MPFYGTVLEGKNIFEENNYKRGVIVIGNEGKGISPEILNKIIYVKSYCKSFAILIIKNTPTVIYTNIAKIRSPIIYNECRKLFLRSKTTLKLCHSTKLCNFENIFMMVFK